MRLNALIVAGIVVSLLLVCVLVGGNVAKVTGYTYDEIADDRPNFPLSRPPFDADGVVRFRSNPSKHLAGVRPSKNVPRVGGRAQRRDNWAICKGFFDGLSPAELAQWETWAGEDDMDVFQFFMRTCQVYEERLISFPPASMEAWKGWVCKFKVTDLNVPQDAWGRVRATADVGSDAFDVSVACKVETDSGRPTSDVLLEVQGWYNDGGGNQWYSDGFSFGAGSHDWATGVLGVGAHNWISPDPRIVMTIYDARGEIWFDEFSVVVGGVEKNPNPHFNEGWDNLWKMPVDYSVIWGMTYGRVALMYLEDVP